MRVHHGYLSPQILLLLVAVIHHVLVMVQLQDAKTAEYGGLKRKLAAAFKFKDFNKSS